MRIVPGEQWQFALRIKPVHGYRNPGGWDYDAWLYHQGVRYTAYVKSTKTAKRIEPNTCCWLDRQRHHLRDKIQQLKLSDSAEGILLALTIGDKSQLSRTDKETFTLTGTSHLMAISGLHIGLAAGLFGGLVNLLWRRTPYLCARYPAILAGTFAGMLAAIIYALLSGFGLPAQRALVMLSIAAIAILYRKQCRPFDVLALAAIAVGIYQPSAVLEAGFWLSFSAVAAILLILPQISGYNRVIQAIILQIGISIALYPVLLIFGMTSHLLAPLINLVLVPVFALFIVPVSLLGTALLTIADWPGILLAVVAYGLDWLLIPLQHLAQQNTFHLHSSGLPWWQTWTLIGGVFILLAPITIKWRLISLLLLGLGHLPNKTEIAQGDYQVTLLDVGQGLSAIVQTQHHTLIYDTGAAYRSGFNLADAVVLPYLRQHNIKHIDRLVISHGDNDHAGSAVHLANAIPIKQILTSEPHRLSLPNAPCYAGQSWTWDNVSFTVLHPKLNEKSKRKSNNASCVLMISNRIGKTLLTGDIEKRTEYQLLPTLTKHAPYSVISAPHHGSNSSSSTAFIQATQAKHVLYPVGAYNRYRFPHKQVWRRWQNHQAQNWRTDQSGAIQFQFIQENGLLGPQQYRIDHKRYWHFPMIYPSH